MTGRMEGQSLVEGRGGCFQVFLLDSLRGEKPRNTLHNPPSSINPPFRGMGPQPALAFPVGAPR
jgi:hypothetical protein